MTSLPEKKDGLVFEGLLSCPDFLLDTHPLSLPRPLSLSLSISMAPKAKKAVKKVAQAVKEKLPSATASSSSKKAPTLPAPTPPPPAAAPSSKAPPSKPTSIAIPPPPVSTSKSSSAAGPKSAKVKTPADEGIDFFEGEVQKGDGDIRVFELKLAEDGGPTKEGAVSTTAILSYLFLISWAYLLREVASEGAKTFTPGLTLTLLLFLLSSLQVRPPPSALPSPLHPSSLSRARYSRFEERDPQERLPYRRRRVQEREMG